MTTLADAIINQQINPIYEFLSMGEPVNQLDEYGFTPLIEAAIANNNEIAKLIIQYHPDVNLKDMTGGTALHWAAENNNIELAKLLIEHGADPNAYNFAGQPALVMPLLRQQQPLKDFLIAQGANLEFAQDFINTKLLGHMFELVGTASILDINFQFVEVDFEGFILEFSIALIYESVMQFKNHFSARQLRRYAAIIDIIIGTLNHAAHLLKYQQYQVDIEKHKSIIDRLLIEEPLIIPVGYEGHAITFIKLGNLFVKCDRREDSRLYDNIMIYQMRHADRCSVKLLKTLLYEQSSSEFINIELPELLGLQPITEIKIPAQISGNCSWANVEACIPTLFFLMCSQSSDFQKNIANYKSLAMNFFNQWREWNQDRALYFCIDSFKKAGPLRKACKAEILATILFQTCQNKEKNTLVRAEKILNVLIGSEYEYILQSYVSSYYYESNNPEGKNFLQLLTAHGYVPPRK